MSGANDVMIRKVCSAFPTTFGIEEDSTSAGHAPVVKYYLDSVLGSGTSGTVFYARRVRDDFPFAIKVMDVGGYSAQDRMRASGEVCCLLNCNYFSIVKCYEDFVLTERNNPDAVLMIALVLDYANAGDLRQEIKNRSRAQRPFVEHEAGLLFIQILLAVHHVHGKRMIHRDIKSANILLCSNGLVKLGDFGFSKHYFQTVSEDVGRTFCGTPYYVAPEIWCRKPYSKKADMFSLGVLLYELLTLKRPFDGQDIDEVMQKTLAGRYEPLPDTISSEMKVIVEALLQPEPKKRPSSKKLLNTAICKLYISVVQEIIQGGPAAGFSAEQEALTTKQLTQTKQELQQERKSRNTGSSLFFEEIMKTATPLSLGDRGTSNNTSANSPSSSVPATATATTTGSGSGGASAEYSLFGGKLYKQSSDLTWKRRYVCVYGEVNTRKHPRYLKPGMTPPPPPPPPQSGSPSSPLSSAQEEDFVNLDLLQAVSKDSMEQQCISIPFAEIEDAFPVVAKYTGSNAEHAFAVAFKNGKRILFDGKTDQVRDEWMRAIQNFLGISDDEY